MHKIQVLKTIFSIQLFAVLGQCQTSYILHTCWLWHIAMLCWSLRKHAATGNVGDTLLHTRPNRAKVEALNYLNDRSKGIRDCNLFRATATFVLHFWSTIHCCLLEQWVSTVSSALVVNATQE